MGEGWLNPSLAMGEGWPDAGLFLEIDIRELLSCAVLHDEGCTNILDGPRRREAAFGDLVARSWRGLTLIAPPLRRHKR